MNKTTVVFILGIVIGFTLALFNPFLTGWSPAYNADVATVQPVFSPGNQLVFENLVRSASDSIELEVYVFTSNVLKEELGNAVERGVRVKVILDRSVNSNLATSRELLAKGVEVKWGSGFELFHSKFLIIDGENVLVGSNNWTFHSLNLNREASVIIKNREIANRFMEIFSIDWSEGVAA